MKYLLILSPSNNADLANILLDTPEDKETLKSVERINDRTWLVDERKGLLYWTTLVHNASVYKLSLSVFRIEDDSRLK
ncbi:MAG: hypothetical protein ACUZ9M_07120 [Candidatus Scalindua sp.]